VKQEIVRYSDVALELGPHPLTGDVTPKINIDSIKQSIRVLMSLDAFDIPFNPYVLSDMRQFLFENFTVITKTGMMKRLEWLISTYEKRVELYSVDIRANDADDGIDVTLTYRIKALNITDTFNQQFQRVR
jgi:phage baseplate assembly protein W